MQVNFSSNKVRAAIAAAGTIVVAGGAVMMPQIAEGASNSCHAVEKKAIKALVAGEDMTANGAVLGVAILNGIVSASNGSMAESAAMTKLPNVPPAIACSARWWQASMPGGSEALKRELQENMAEAFNN